MVSRDGRARRGFFADEEDPEQPEPVESMSANRAASELIDDTEDLIPVGRQTRRQHVSRTLKSLFAVVLSLGLLLGGGYFVYTQVRHAYLAGIDNDYHGTGVTPIVVTIPKGATVTDIAELLKSKDVVKTSRAFISAAHSDPKSNQIQAGSYKMKTQMSASSALAILMSPENIVQRPVLVREGLRDTEVFTAISKDTGLSVADLTSAAKDGVAIGLPSYANGNPEGFLFPATYNYDPAGGTSGILKQMTGEFGKVAAEVSLEQKAAALGITPQQAVTVASIIEKETRNPTTYGPLIAEVIYNRLKVGMKLQLDSTVIYANDAPSTATTTDQQRALNSPYNTYVAKALPPGPISNPGADALKAALNPEKGDYLYFVAVNLETGETKFATTDTQHVAHVAEFQAWCQANPKVCT